LTQNVTKTSPGRIIAPVSASATTYATYATYPGSMAAKRVQMTRYELRHELGRRALEFLDAGTLPAADLPDGGQGARSLEQRPLWVGALLGQPQARPLEFRSRVAASSQCQAPQEGEWRSTGSGGLGMDTYELDQILADHLPACISSEAARKIRCA